jgi:adenylate cyclase class 2
MENREIEVKFLEIDKPKLIEKLKSLGASDLGEELLTQKIFRDKAGKWKNEGKFARIRMTSKGIVFTYKHVENRTATGTIEIEFEITQPDKLEAFLIAMDLELVHESEKRRHKFRTDNIIVDIDTWPKIPTFVELEGPTEESIKNLTSKLGFDWTKGKFGTYDLVIEEEYKIPVRSLRYFTFDRVE